MSALSCRWLVMKTVLVIAKQSLLPSRFCYLYNGLAKNFWHKNIHPITRTESSWKVKNKKDKPRDYFWWLYNGTWLIRGRECVWSEKHIHIYFGEEKSLDLIKAPLGGAPFVRKRQPKLPGCCVWLVDVVKMEKWPSMLKRNHFRAHSIGKLRLIWVCSFETGNSLVVVLWGDS